ncbi:MAG: DUF5906 domain-containing protein [Lachnospiraceae bacterium]|nr:DUF5906 domain-containing protein [Lachnospiraceae bacterium]
MKNQAYYYLRSRDEIISEVTSAFCAGLSPTTPVAPKRLASVLLDKVVFEIIKENSHRAKISELLNKYQIPPSLTPAMVARLMDATYYIRNVNMMDKKGDSFVASKVLAVYINAGPAKGTYVSDADTLKQIAIGFEENLTERDLNEVLKRLSLICKTVDRTMDQDLIAVNNGVFNFQTKKLLPFSSEYIFLYKLPVAYNPNAVNVTITADDGSKWDFESWMDSLSDDPDIVSLLWEILSALVRPFVSWDKSFWFTNEKGCNGKGTLISLMRSLCGNTAISIPLSQFSSRFGLANIIGKTAVLVDENDVGDFIENLANYKAVVTGDEIIVERKHENVVNYTFRGITVFCINDKPRIKDRTQSLYRRIAVVPFDHCFTGKERKEIKDDYLKRQEVLEYVLYRVLHMWTYSFTIPESCLRALEEYKVENDPIRQFAEEILPQITWDFAPFDFLFELYKCWFRKNNPNGRIEGSKKFNRAIVSIVDEGGTGWMSIPDNAPKRVGLLMDGPEYLIAEYEVSSWYNRIYCGHDLCKICSPELKEIYRGIQRIEPHEKAS